MNKKTRIVLIASLSLNSVFLVAALLLVSTGRYRRITLPYLRNYYLQRLGHFESLSGSGIGIVFVGDSLTDRCEWGELFERHDIANRGIDADTTDGVLNRIGEITRMKPRKVFILVGGADLIIGRKPNAIVKNYARIIRGIRAASPGTTVYAQSVLPTRIRRAPLTPEAIIELNRGIKSLCEESGVRYVDLHDIMTDARGDLDARYTFDGVHLNGAGYQVWRAALLPLLE
ncbi:MAG: hypothetical protein JW838_11105 [Spirochaetes bacterium]|nr:hypothetical protein [Spirochaetota bacterium]